MHREEMRRRQWKKLNEKRTTKNYSWNILPVQRCKNYLFIICAGMEFVLQCKYEFKFICSVEAFIYLYIKLKGITENKGNIGTMLELVVVISVFSIRNIHKLILYFNHNNNNCHRRNVFKCRRSFTEFSSRNYGFICFNRTIFIEVPVQTHLSQHIKCRFLTDKI